MVMLMPSLPVHACGGTVIATDEATSSSFSMPSATIERDHAFDHVVALDDVAELLATLAAARVG
jgi:two-component system chemotaxis response regulator CheB